MKTKLENLSSLSQESPKFYVAILIFAGIGILFVIGLLLFGVKNMQFEAMAAAGETFSPPPETITTARAELQKWETSLNSVGSLTAVNGVTIAAEQSGNIEKVAFTPGSLVVEGDLLVQQDATTEQAQYRAALASAELAKINLKRRQDLIKKKLTSRSEYDAAVAQYDAAIAEVDSIRSLIDEKTIRAPFSGKVGVQNVYDGQYLHAGEAIVSLQSLDPLHVNFKLPQQHVARVSNGLSVRVETNALPGQVINGSITAIDPEVDASTRNTAIQATIPNTEEKLLPGMFVKVSIILPEEKEVLSIPATSVVYAPYGASVYIVDEETAEENGESKKVARQQFVKLGRMQGDFVAVTSGLKPQDLVVSTGAFKLFNGQSVVENNKLAPEFKLQPNPDDT